MISFARHNPVAISAPWQFCDALLLGFDCFGVAPTTQDEPATKYARLKRTSHIFPNLQRNMIIVGAFAAVALWDGLKKTQGAHLLGLESRHGPGISLPLQHGTSCQDMRNWLDIYPKGLEQRGDLAYEFSQGNYVDSCDMSDDAWQNYMDVNSNYSLYDINHAMDGIASDYKGGLLDRANVCAAAKLLAAPPKNTYQLADYNNTFNFPSTETKTFIDWATHPIDGKCHF